MGMRLSFTRGVMLFAVAGAVALAWPAVTAAALARPEEASSTNPPPPPALHTYRQQLGTSGLSANAAGVALKQPYSYWYWNGNYYRDSSQALTIENSTTPGAPFFWSYQFKSHYGDGGYVGLQDNSAPTGTKIALFSVWAADGAQGANCEPFSGEGDGWTCRIDPYNWVPDREYVVGISIDRTGRSGAWYRGTVTDTVTLEKRTIGLIHVPTGWGQLTGFASWTEYFGPQALTCADLPKARARFAYPIAKGGTVQITGHSHQIGEGDCLSSITDFPGGDRQIAPK
jgi:hypothetical protein